MPSGKEAKVLVTLTHEYVPKSEEYPDTVQRTTQQAQLDTEVGLFREMVENGQGEFRTAIARGG